MNLQVIQSLQLKDLPSWSKLNSRVRRIEEESSWIERHGIDWLHIIGSVIAYSVGLLWLRTDSAGSHIAGTYQTLFVLHFLHPVAHSGGSDSLGQIDFYSVFVMQIKDVLHSYQSHSIYV